MSIHDYGMWKDEHQKALNKWKRDAVDQILAVGLRVGIRPECVKELTQIREVDGWWRLDVEFGFPRRHATSWWNYVKLVIDTKTQWDVDDDRRRSYIVAAVELKVHTSSEMDPHVAGRLGGVLSEVALVAMRLETSVTSLFMDIGDKPLDPVKASTQQERSDRRSFLYDAYSAAQRGSTTAQADRLRLSHRWFTGQDCLLNEFIKQYREDGECSVISRRYEGRDRKMLNAVPTAVVTVSHHRGASSDIFPTDKLEAHIAQVVADRREEAA